MEIRGSQKYLLNKMSEQDYRTGIVQLMCILEEHSKEFTTPSELVSLVHEYSELMTTIWSLDNKQDTSDREDDLDDEELDEELDDEEDIATILYGVFHIPLEEDEEGDEPEDD